MHNLTCKLFKVEVEISFELKEMATRFQGAPAAVGLQCRPTAVGAPTSRPTIQCALAWGCRDIYLV